MNSFLLNRSIGSVSARAFATAQTNRLVHALQPTPGVRFDESPVRNTDDSQESHIIPEDEKRDLWAHNTGVNSIVIDPFEGRYLISGGADATIHLWDLELAENTSRSCIHRPIGTVIKNKYAHKYGLTHVSFYPFDAGAFLSSSYDHTLKLTSIEDLKPGVSFNLDSVIYTHSVSPIADHVLVACATQHPAVRLVDLKSGSATHSLLGHHGAVLAVNWCPTREYILASGGLDGTVRLWDVRRSASSLGVLDQEDNVGIGGYNGQGNGARAPHRGKAHSGPCNSVSWTEDGLHIISSGHDEKIRVWDAGKGANTLANFGPIIRNQDLACVKPLLAPSIATGRGPGKSILFWPNEWEILVFDLFEGRLIKKLRAPGAKIASAAKSRGERGTKQRITSLIWRAQNVEMYSSHADGTIKSWMPRTKEDAEVEELEDELAQDEDCEDGRKRKRGILDDIFKDLTKQKITFG